MSPLLRTPLSTEHALLGFVRHEPLHGYEIHRRLTETAELRMVWRMKQSRLYALLARLEDDGLLEAILEPQDNRPPRKVFHITPAGKDAYNRWLTQPVKLPRELRLEFMLKLYFGIEEGPETVTHLIRQQQELCAQWSMAWDEDDALASPYIRSVRHYRRNHIDAIRNWLAWLLSELAGKEQPVE